MTIKIDSQRGDMDESITEESQWFVLFWVMNLAINKLELPNSK